MSECVCVRVCVYVCVCVCVRFEQNGFLYWLDVFGRDSKVGRLPELLRNDLLETFVTKLAGLHHPHLRWKEGLSNVLQLLKANKTAEAWE